MAISQALIDQQSSKRFILAKIEPTRVINSTLSSLGGGLYSVALPFKYLKNVKRNSTTLTADPAAPTVNDHYYYSDGTLTIKLAGAPADDNIITVQYALYFSSDETVTTYDPPTDTSGDKFEYEPRIMNSPEFSVSISDIQNGVFSINGTSLSLNNTDRELNQYFTVNDWYKFKDVLLYVCYESEENCAKFYTGVITDVDFNDATVNFIVGDNFTKLSSAAYLGPRTEAIANYTEFPSIYPKHIGVNIPMVMASSTPGAAPFDDFGHYGAGSFVDPVAMNKAICTDYNSTGDNTDNRAWQLCRVFATGGDRIKAVDFGTPNSFSAFAPIGSPFIVTIGYASALTFSQHNLEIGDSFAIEYGAWIGYGIITHLDYSAREIKGYSPNWDSTNWDTTTKNLAAIGSFAGTKCFVALKDLSTNKFYIPIHEYEYTINSTPSDSGYSIDIFFESTLESTMGDRQVFAGWSDGYATYNNFPDYELFDSTYLNPDKFEVVYKLEISDDVDFTFENVIKEMVEAVGLTVDTPFTNIPASTPTNTEDIRTEMQIPDKDELSYDSYLKYLQELLRPFACFLKLDSTGDNVSLVGFATPASDGEAFDEDNILAGSLSIETDFNDIKTEIISYNDYGYVWSFTVTDEIAEALNGVKASTTIIHTMQYLNDRLQVLLDILKNRKAVYKFKTATAGFNRTIGDSITLTHNNILGGAASVNLMITGISKNIEGVSIEASDLGGL